MTAALTLIGSTAQAATIASVSPQGEVAQVRQITVKFAEAVVAFGDLRLSDPLALSCQGAAPVGAGRWANDRVWLYDFREPLPPGTRCTLRARPEWKPLAGTLTGATDYSFNTGGPAVASVQPYDGGQIAEDQHFLLRLNGAAVESTVLANAWCEVEGIGERIGVNVISGDARAALLKARGIEKKDQIERALILACKRPLPNAAAVRLVWGKGIGAAAKPKVTTAIEQRFRFTVRPAFTAEFSCERENANAPCLPIRTMTVRFSAPVARALAAKVRLNPPSGSALAPVFDKDDNTLEVSQIKFAVPLPENTGCTVEVPSDLRDTPIARSRTRRCSR